jgi:hypothetical protein
MNPKDWFKQSHEHKKNEQATWRKLGTSKIPCVNYDVPRYATHNPWEDWKLPVPNYYPSPPKINHAYSLNLARNCDL